MEKNFTLMKTLSAFCNLLLFRSRKKNVCAINNDGVFATGCCTVTTVNSKSNHTTDAKQHDASFLFYDQSSINDQTPTGGSSSSNQEDEKLKSNEELSGVNDELAAGNGPAPVYDSRRWKVNDDLAACTAVDDPLFPPLKNLSKRKNENINVDHIFTINDTTTINTYKTRTNKNDALLPFASFSFLFTDSLVGIIKKKALAKMRLCKIIFKDFFSLVEYRNGRLVLLTVSVREKKS